MLQKSGEYADAKIILESKGLIDQQDLDAITVEGVGVVDDLVVGQGGGGRLEDLAAVGRGQRHAPLSSALKSLRIVLDDLVDSCNNNDLASTVRDRADFGTGLVTMAHRSSKSDGADGGQEVVRGGAKSATKLSLLSGVLLGQDGATDVVVGGLTHKVVDESNLLEGGRVSDVQRDTLISIKSTNVSPMFLSNASNDRLDSRK